MNYQRIYAEFIADRKEREADLIASGNYFERHHILPRSLGGSNKKDNLISLTAEDHYFAHLLLAKIYGGNQWAGLWAISGLKVSQRSLLFVNRHMVGVARRKKAEIMKLKNPSHRDDVKEKRRQQLLKDNPIFRIDRTGSNNPMYGVKLTGEKNGMFGKKHSDEWKKQRSIDSKKWNEKNYTPVKCVQTGEIFANQTLAAKSLGISQNRISLAISRDHKCCGYNWVKV